MRKNTVIILAVAIIGLLGIAAKNHKDDGASLAAASSANQASTMGASVKMATGSGAGRGAHMNPGAYKDGTYNGASQDTPYGMVQVAAVIIGGRITDVKFLQMPSDRGHTQEVTAFAEPLLKQQAIQKQSAHIDFVSGATTTCEAYQMSLQAALDQAV